MKVSYTVTDKLKRHRVDQGKTDKKNILENF